MVEPYQLKKKYKQKTIRTGIKHKGKIPSNKIPTFNLLENIRNVYLLCAISYNSVFLFLISEEPINSITFNAFLHKFCSRINEDNEYGFFLIENASFHSIDDIIIEKMKAKKVSITRTPPIECLKIPLKNSLLVLILF